MQRILEEVGCHTREYEWPDYWYFGEERALIKDCGEVALLFWRLCHLPYCAWIYASFSPNDDGLCSSDGLVDLQDEDLQRVHELFAAVGKMTAPRTDISAMQWLKQQVCWEALAVST